MKELSVEASVDDIISVVSNVTSPFVVISELIKNGVDANANQVIVELDTKNNEIRIKDDGDGFTLKEINELAKIAQSSKKRKSFIENDKGQTLLGSKGLAVYSVFSLGNKLEIFTCSDDGEFHIVWELEKGLFYEKKEGSAGGNGTVVLISNIENDDMILLSSEKELNKFKHLTIGKFINHKNLATISLFKDEESFDIFTENIESFESEFDVVVSFEYSSKDNVINYSYSTEDDRITSEKLHFDLNSVDKIDLILEEIYNFKPEKIGFDDYLTGGLIEIDEIVIPSFKGKWWVKRGRKTNKMNIFESGIRFYVNNFALYNYLNRNNDWLQLTNISQTKKINDFRQHNVYGYVSFNNFDDLSEGMKISNERGGFIENKYYHKFIDILYNFILYPSISINVALKNNLFIETIIEKEQNLENKNLDTVNNGGGILKDENSAKADVNTNSTKSLPSISRELKRESISKQILNITTKEIEVGQRLHLKDPEIVNKDLIDNVTIIHNNLKVDTNKIIKPENPIGTYAIEYYVENAKEVLTLKIRNKRVINNKLQKGFFKGSNHFEGVIDLSDINELVHQLDGLSYDRKYLLYIISFRAILEDLVKSYIANRDNLSLANSLKGNIEIMIDDLLNVIQIKRNDSLETEKKKVHKKFKGNNALKNFLITIKIKFSNHSYDQFLHSLTHNPTKITKELALEISNDMILPLYILIKSLRDEKII